MADGGVATIFGVLQPEEEEILISELEVQHGPAVAKKMKRHFRSSANEDEKDEKILCQQLAQAASLSEDAAEKVIEWCRRIVHDMQQIGEEMREGGEDLPDGDEAEDGAPQAGSHVGGNSTNGNSSANNGGIAASGGPSGGIQLSTNSSSGGVVLQPASGNPSSGVVIHPANSNANGGAQDHNRNAGGSIITPAADRPRRQGGTLGIFASAVGQVKNQSRQGQQPPTVRPPQRARPSRSRSRSVASEEDVSDISNEEPRARANAREAAPPAKRFRADEDDVRAEESEGEQVRKKEKKLKKEKREKKKKKKAKKEKRKEEEERSPPAVEPGNMVHLGNGLTGQVVMMSSGSTAPPAAGQVVAAVTTTPTVIPAPAAPPVPALPHHIAPVGGPPQAGAQLGTATSQTAQLVTATSAAAAAGGNMVLNNSAAGGGENYMEPVILPPAGTASQSSSYGKGGKWKLKKWKVAPLKSDIIVRDTQELASTETKRLREGEIVEQTGPELHLEVKDPNTGVRRGYVTRMPITHPQAINYPQPIGWVTLSAKQLGGPEYFLPGPQAVEVQVGGKKGSAKGKKASAYMMQGMSTAWGGAAATLYKGGAVGGAAAYMYGGAVGGKAAAAGFYASKSSKGKGVNKGGPKGNLTWTAPSPPSQPATA